MAGRYSDYKFDNVRADALFLRGRYKDAFHAYFRGATISRDGRAAFNLAYMYHRGIYLLRNYEKARLFYAAAAHMDGGEAEFNLALMCMRGEGGPPDFREAVARMKKAAGLGCIEAEVYLGNAFTLGYIFDPADIECLSLIPFHRLIRRKPIDNLIAGEGFDPGLEDARWEVIEADELEAMAMFRAAARHADTEYAGEMSGLARFMVGRGLIEGYGGEYDPARGWRMIVGAAKLLGCREAEVYLAGKMEEALAYGVNPDRPAELLYD